MLLLPFTSHARLQLIALPALYTSNINRAAGLKLFGALCTVTLLGLSIQSS